jgi:hypothetical protein
VAPALLDDHLLSAALLGPSPLRLQDGSDRWFTTGLWHHRLCRAVTNRAIVGRLSRRLDHLPPDDLAGFQRQLLDLPPTIGLVSLRHLAWPMAQLLDQGVRLNLLSLEALAAAEELGATICLAPEDENPPLVEAAEARGVEVQVVPIG